MTETFTVAEPHVINGGRRDWHNGSEQCCSQCSYVAGLDLDELLRFDEADRRGLVRFSAAGGDRVAADAAASGYVPSGTESSEHGGREPVGPVDGGREVVPAGRVQVAAGDAYAGFGASAGPPALWPDRDGVIELFTAVRGRQAAMVSTPAAGFATVQTGTDVGADIQMLTDRQGPAPTRLAEVARIQAQEVSPASGVSFPVFNAGSAATTGEAALKAEYSNVAPGTATPQVVATWTDITMQVQMLTAFESKLRNKLERLVAATENELLRSKVAGTAGIQALAFGGSNQATRILQGAAMVEAAVNTRADVFVFHPDDTETIFGSAVGNAVPADVARLSLSLFGMVGVPLASQPAGSVLAGAWSASSRLVVGLPPTYKVDPYSQMKSNVVTVLLEEALDLAVEEPEGFITVDIASA